MGAGSAFPDNSRSRNWTLHGGGPPSSANGYGRWVVTWSCVHPPSVEANCRSPSRKRYSHMHSGTIRIAIADDHPIFRDGLRRLLESESNLQVVGEASDGRQALDLVSHAKPDILLLDMA